MTSTRRWSQFSLRGLVALTVVVGLSIAYWQESTSRRKAESRLNHVLATPRMWLVSDDPFQKFSVISGIGAGGGWYVNKVPFRDPRVTMELIRADTLAVVKEMPVSPSFNEASQVYTFAGTFQHSPTEPWNVTAGTYIIRAKSYDGNKHYATDVRVIEVVDR